MYGRRYRLLIGKAYGSQATFTPSVPTIPSVEFVNSNRPENFLQLSIADLYKEAIYRKRTPEEIAQNENAILAGFVEFNVNNYVNKYYTRAADLEDGAGFLLDSNIEFTEHHVEFEIEKVGGNSTDGNVGVITLFNLSEAESQFLVSLASTQNFAHFSAGYADEGMKTLIRGNITIGEDKSDGTNRRTKITITDGDTFVKNQMSVRTYRKGTDVKQIVNDLLDDIALPRGSIQIPSQILTKPLVVHGRSVEQLKRVLDVYGHSVNIQDLYIDIFERTLSEEAERAIEEATRVPQEVVDVDVDRIISVRVQEPAGYVYNVRLVSPGSGLISVPGAISDTSSMTTQEIANEPTAGVKFKHLLSGDLSPNTYVQIRAGENYTGNYRIIKATHSGSLEGSRWETTVEAELIAIKPDAVNADESEDAEEEQPPVEMSTEEIISRQVTFDLNNEILEDMRNRNL